MKKLNKPLNLNRNFEFLIKCIFFIFIFSWFVFTFILKLGFYADFFAILIALSSLSGFIIGINRSTSWGFGKSLVGRSLISLSFGLLMWFFGQTFYFIDYKIENPLGIYEFFFIFIDPFYLLGIFFLAQAVGTFNYLKSNFSLIFLPILIFVLNLLIVSFLNDRDFIEMVLNINIDDVYIFGSIVLATFVITILVFSKKIGGIYKTALFYLLVGILFQYVGDNLYAFLETQEANGSIADLLFFTSISLVTFGILKLDPQKLNE